MLLQLVRGQTPLGVDMFVSGVVQNKLDDATKVLRAAVEEVLQATLSVSTKGCEPLLRSLLTAADNLFEADEEHTAAVSFTRRMTEISFETAASVNAKSNAKTRAAAFLDQALSAAGEAGVPRSALCALGDANRAANQATLAIRRLRQPFRVTSL